MSKVLIILNIISLFFIVQIKLKIIPLFPSSFSDTLSSDINDIIFRASIGLILSSFFYLIVVYLPKKKQEQSTLKIIQPRLNTIVQDLTPSVYYLTNKRLILANKSIDKYKDSDFKSLTSLDKRKMDFKYEYLNDGSKWTQYSTGDWLELDHFTHHRKLIISKIDEILLLPTIIYVDSELIELLAKLRDCQFYVGIEYFSKAEFIDSQAYVIMNGTRCKFSFGDFNVATHDYCLLFSQLKKFADVHEFKVSQTE